jgi:signal transduction histidine kinase/ligand-binding sensor domain-containing protein
MGAPRGRCATLAALLLAALASSATHGAGHGVDDVRFLRYGVEDGISQLTVRALAQDDRGFVWLGTQDGLNRFDGYNFRVFRHDAGDPRSLVDNHVVALAASRDGSMWVGTQAGGLSHYLPESESFNNIPPDPARGNGLADATVTALLADASGRLWVGGASGSLQWLESESEARFRSLAVGTSRNPGPIRSLRQRRDGSVLVGARGGLWVCTQGGQCGVEWRYDRERRLDVYDALEGPDGYVWVLTADDGLYQFGGDGTPITAFRAGEGGGEGLVSGEGRVLLFDARGRLWIGTNAGLSRLDRERRSFRSWRNDPALADSLASNRVHALLEDRDGQVWVGTWLNGVDLFDPRTEAFSLIRPATGDPTAIPAPPVRAVHVDADGTLWFGILEGGGLVHFDLARGVLRRWVRDADDPDSIVSNNVQAITRRRDGSLWVGTSAGLDRLRADGSGFDHFTHSASDPGSLAANGILHLYADREDTLWISTEGGGLDALCAGCTEFRHYPPDPLEPTALAGGVVNNVFETRGGEFWVGLRPGGLARMDRRTGEVERFRADATRPGSLSNEAVTSIMEDGEGRLWIGTQGGGVNQVLRDATTGAISFRAWTRSQGLGADAIGGVVQDSGGHLWISTTAGMTRFDPVSGAIDNFTQNNGAQVAGYFVGAYGERSDGLIVFGGMRGATVVDPAHVPSVPALHRTAITGVRALRSDPRARLETTYGDQGPRSVAVPWQLGDISIEFSALSYVDPLSVRYEYRLDGFDQGWIATDARHRYATYTNLPAGDYVFHVRAQRESAPPGEESLLAIRIDAAPWATWWAKALYFAIAATVLGMLVWQTRQRLHERARAQRAAEEGEQRLMLALWGTGDELWDIDLETGSFVRINPLQHLKVTHEAKENSLRAYSPYVHRDDLAAFNAAIVAHVKGETEFLEASYRSPDREGNWRWLRSRGRVVRRGSDGRAQRVVGTTEDITDIKEHEQALERINVQLEQRVAARTSDLTVANESLRHTIGQLRDAQAQLVESEKMAALGGLVAGVAHEINTPLGVGVTASSHLDAEARRLGVLIDNGQLQRSDLDAFQRMARESTQLILRNLQRADKLVKSFKQVAVDQSSEQRRTIDLGGYLDEILTSLHPALKKTRHEVVVDCPAGLSFETYPGAIYQIVVNLVMNSLLHGFDGVESGHIRITVTPGENALTIVYEDDGRGMGEETRRHVFEPFFTTRRGEGGSGLGLHIAYNLATQVLRGTIAVESAPGRGVRFTVRFPVETRAVA